MKWAELEAGLERGVGKMQGPDVSWVSGMSIWKDGGAVHRHVGSWERTGLRGICEFSLVVLRYGAFETQAPRGAFTGAVG